jgi:hypothetical protein
LWLASATAGAAFALEPDVLFRKVAGSVWAVRTFDAQERPLRAGSAVVIAPGRLVTNCHVLAKASGFVVKQDNVTYGATLEFPDPARDLCQIKVSNFNAAPVVLAPAGSARVGQRVYAVGNPRGLENTLSEGILSGLRGGEGIGGSAAADHGRHLARLQRRRPVRRRRTPARPHELCRARRWQPEFRDAGRVPGRIAGAGQGRARSPRAGARGQ